VLVGGSLARRERSEPTVASRTHNSAAAESGAGSNHRRNLDVYIVEARKEMYSIREKLEK
jgi:hypothetical protein